MAIDLFVEEIGAEIAQCMLQFNTIDGQWQGFTSAECGLMIAECTVISCQ